MTPQARGPLDIDLEAIAPRDFELVVFAAAYDLDRRVQRVRAPDYGLDARLPGDRNQTRRGWQAKQAADIKWNDCRTSVRRAMGFWRTTHVTFGFSHDLTASETAKWQKHVVEHFPHMRLDFWAGEQLRSFLRSTDAGRRLLEALYRDDDAHRQEMLRAMATDGELNSTGQAAQRAAVIASYMDRDPQFYYTQVARNPAAPETPSAPGTVISVATTIDGQEVRFDAAERYPGALLDANAVPAIGFSDDADGRRARAALAKLLEHGGRAVIASGIGTSLPQIPIGLQGLLPDEGVWGPAEIIVDETRAARPAADDPRTVVASVEDLELAFTMSRVEPVANAIGTLAGSIGGMEVFIVMSPEPSGGHRTRIDFQYTRGQGSAVEQLMAAQMMRGLAEGKLVEFKAPDGQFLLSASMERTASSDSEREELDALVTFLELATEVEAWIGKPVNPPRRPSEDDAKVLSVLVALLREPQRTSEWEPIPLSPDTALPEGDGPWQFALLQPLHARLFGHEHYVGMEWIHFPAGHLKQGDPPMLVPGASGAHEATIRLCRPDEVPADAAEPPVPSQ